MATEVHQNAAQTAKGIIHESGGALKTCEATRTPQLVPIYILVTIYKILQADQLMACDDIL